MHLHYQKHRSGRRCFGWERVLPQGRGYEGNLYPLLRALLDVRIKNIISGRHEWVLQFVQLSVVSICIFELICSTRGLSPRNTTSVS